MRGAPDLQSAGRALRALSRNPAMELLPDRRGDPVWSPAGVAPPSYSYRSAMIGSTRAARQAGYIPAMIPVPPDSKRPIAIQAGER